MVSVFVGEGRKALVNGIINRLDKLTDHNGDSRACLISLEAPSGWGKTRIIQEVYKKIAERQVSPYWPHSILPDDEDDPVSRRKHLAPSFIDLARNRDVLPEFFWWGLTCDMRSTNMLSRSLTEDIEQLRFHAPYLEASWAASKLTRLGKYATIAKAKSALGALFEEGATTGLSKLAELGLGATPFGIGLGLKLVTSGAKAMKDKKEEDAKMGKGFEAHRQEDEDLVEETVNLLARLAHKDLPIIICVEDIQKATSPVLELLAKLLARNAPILILTTTWPDEFEKIDTFQPLLVAPWATDRIIRMHYNKSAPKGLPEEASLSQLPPKDLGEIILARYPKAENDVITRLTARYKNPLPLELVLNMDSLKQDYPYLELDAEDVAELPETVRDLYNSLWNELPKPVQQLLALSTELMPEGQPEWLMSLITDALDSFKDDAWAKDISAIAVNNNIPHGWSRIVEGWLRRFGEEDQLSIAQARVKELFGKRQLRLFNEAVSHAIEEFDFNECDINDAEAIHKAWLAMAFFDLQFVNLETYLSAGLFLIKSMEDKPLEWKRALQIGTDLLAQSQKIINITDSQTKLIIDLRSCIARIHGESGALSEALERLKSLLEDQIRILDPDNPDILRTRNSIAHYLGESGALSKALERLKPLLEDQIRILGPDHPDVLRTRNNIAHYLGESGDLSEALERLKSLLEDQIHILGPDHLYVLRNRNNIALNLGQSGAHSEGLERLESLLQDQVRILGPDHPEVLVTRNNIGGFLGNSGAPSEALEILKPLLEDQIRILGSDHPDVLRTRINIAANLGNSGAQSEALERLKSLLEDQIRILGPDHPYVLLTRSNIALTLGIDGALSEALERLKVLLEDQIRILGPDHPDVLLTRNNIGYYLGKSAVPSEALERLKSLLEDQIRILGPDHPYVLLTRNNIALNLGQDGGHSEALEILKPLLEDQMRILGPDHPDTLNSRRRISNYQEKLNA